MRALLLGMAALTVACAGHEEVSVAGRQPTSTALAPPAAGAAQALDVLVRDADVTGSLAERLRAEPGAGGLLLPGEPLVTFVRLVATDGDIPIGPIPWFADSIGGLGFGGVCGPGWMPDGTRVTDDPCAAASPVRSVSAAVPLDLLLVLYPRTEAGPASPGTYEFVAPIEAGGELRVEYEVLPHDEAHLPPIAGETATLAVVLEEPGAGDAVEILVEDPWRRELARFRGTGEVEIPAGTARVVPLVDGERCGGQHVILEPGEATTLTLIVSCPP